jgi:hypothetical protein
MVYHPNPNISWSEMRKKFGEAKGIKNKFNSFYEWVNSRRHRGEWEHTTEVAETKILLASISHNRISSLFAHKPSHHFLLLSCAGFDFLKKFYFYQYILHQCMLTICAALQESKFWKFLLKDISISSWTYVVWILIRKCLFAGIMALTVGSANAIANIILQFADLSVISLMR